MKERDRGYGEIIKAAREQGWRVELNRRNHYRLYSPDGVGQYSMPSSPSDWRGPHRAASDLRKLGLILPSKHARRS